LIISAAEWPRDSLPGVRATTSLIVCTTALHLLIGCSREPTPSPTRAPQKPATLTLSVPVEHLEGILAREPMIVEHPNGTIFVTGYGAPTPNLWKSTDQGATRTRVNVGTEKQGAVAERQKLDAADQLSGRRVADGIGESSSLEPLALPSRNDGFRMPRRAHEVVRKVEAPTVLGIRVGGTQHRRVVLVKESQDDRVIGVFDHGIG
jgi:hypothetical protein